MARRRGYTPEQIIPKLREDEIYLGQGKTVKEASKLIEDHRTNLLSLAKGIWGIGHNCKLWVPPMKKIM